MHEEDLCHGIYPLATKKAIRLFRFQTDALPSERLSET